MLLACNGVASAGASEPAAAPRVHWGAAEEVPGTAALNAGGSAAVSAVSCWRPGGCAAGGFYTDASGHRQAFVVIQRNWAWGQAEEVPGTAALNAGGNAQVTTLSCAPRSAGGCAVAGTYTDSAGNTQVFVASQAGGSWGAAQEIPGTGRLNVGGLANVGSISCASAGNCAAGGFYESYPPPPDSPNGNSNQAFVVAERDGRWSRAEEVPGIAALNTTQYPDNFVRSVSCASAGNCTAGGLWWGVYAQCSPGNATCPRGFVLSLVNGRWHRLVQPRGGGAVSSVSCWHAGDCTAAGSIQSINSGTPAIAFAETETNGRWGKARRPAAISGDVITSASCPSAGNCAVGGNDGSCECDAGTTNGTFVFSERGGRWGKVDNLSGPASLGTISSLSCSSAGNCGGGGSGYAGDDQYGNPLSQAFVIGERDGRWAAPETPPGEAALDLGGNAQVSSVSCPSAGNCVAGGSYTDAAGHGQAFVDGTS